MRIIKFVFFVLLYSYAFSIQAQNLGLSAYSRIGIGDLADPSSSRHLGMGGAGVGLAHEYQWNSLNPAALAALKSTNFEFDLKARRTTLQTAAQNQTGTVANISSISIAMPLHPRFVIQMGARPFSSVSYEDDFATGGAGKVYSTEITGSGGLSDFFLGAGYNHKNWLMLGLNGGFISGQISHDVTRFSNDLRKFVENSLNYQRALRFSPGILIAKEIKRNVVRELQQDTLVKINDSLVTAKKQVVVTEPSNNWFVGVGLTGSFYHTIQATEEYYYAEEAIDTDTASDGREFFPYKPVVESIIARTNALSGYKLPNSIKLGASLFKPNRIVFALDYTFSSWSNFSFNAYNAAFRDHHKVALGVELIPSYNSIKYYKRIAYRAGLNWSSLPYTINGQSINEMQATLGGSFVIPRTGTTFNLALAYGQRGTTEAGLIKENYWLVTLGIINNSKWFVRRKHD